MRKLLKSRKALSPVVAAIILIAVTVAVSIAVAAWMGALTFTFVKTESVEWPTTVTWTPATPNSTNTVSLTIKNTGSVDIYLSVCKVNGVTKTFNGTTTSPLKIPTGESRLLLIQAVGWSYGYNYELRFIATSGTEFTRTYTAA